MQQIESAIEILQSAFVKWPNDVSIAYNLIVCLDAYVCEIKDSNYQNMMKNPTTMRKIKFACEFIVDWLRYLISIRKIWSGDSEALSQAKYSIVNFSPDNIKTEDIGGHSLPPCGLGLIPDEDVLKMILQRFTDSLLPFVRAKADEVEKKYEEAFKKRLEEKQQAEKAKEQSKLDMIRIQQEEAANAIWQLEQAEQMLRKAQKQITETSENLSDTQDDSYQRNKIIGKRRRELASSEDEETAEERLRRKEAKKLRKESEEKSRKTHKHEKKKKKKKHHHHHHRHHRSREDEKELTSKHHKSEINEIQKKSFEDDSIQNDENETVMDKNHYIHTHESDKYLSLPFEDTINTTTTFNATNLTTGDEKIIDDLLEDGEKLWENRIHTHKTSLNEDIFNFDVEDDKNIGENDDLRNQTAHFTPNLELKKEGESMADEEGLDDGEDWNLEF